MVASIEVAGRRIGPGAPCFIIAEAGVNHNGKLVLAKRLIDAAASARADAVKFQTFDARRLSTGMAPKAAYQSRHGARGSQQAMLQKLELSEAAHRALADYAYARGLMFLSTPFDEASADLLDRLGVPAFKMASGELTNLPFLAYVARKGRPLIVSTGMATLAEVRAAVDVIRRARNLHLVLLHCVSAYPAQPADANLRAVQTLARTFRVPSGYSDHTLGIDVALGAVALGACVIEKHLTLDRAWPGPDHQASLVPSEFTALVRGIRTVESALGTGRKTPVPSEAEIAAVARKSLVAAKPIPQGRRLTRNVIAIKRPGTGLAPSMLDRVLGRRTIVSIPADTVLAMEMLTS